MDAVFKADGTETEDRYSVSEWWLPAGDPGVGSHVHDANDELFFVIEGTVTFRIAEVDHEAESGAFLRIPAGVSHGFRNASRARAGVLNVFIPGGFERHMPDIVAWFASRDVDTTER
jgi:mannose-6-phosphate isomerase-like protein (cupin superfamily)